MAKEVKPKPEREIAREILKHLRQHNVLCWRHEPNTYNHALGRHVSNPYVMSGAPDIIAVLEVEGFCVTMWIEVKRPDTGKLSADQILFSKRIKSLNGYYFVVTSVDDIKNAYDKTVRSMQKRISSKTQPL